MKFNKWTLGLAAVGVVSMASVAKAEETMSMVKTAVSGTTIYGFVDTSVEWAVCRPSNIPSGVPFGAPFRGGKADGFNLNAVGITIEKPLDETPWASGYRVQLIYGPDAVEYNPVANGGGGSGLAIKQAYVIVRVPVGNGLDIKIGVFDTILGYEVFESGNNPNFTRSYGYSIEPTQHTGVLGTYHINDNMSVSLGVANTHSTGINTRFNNAYTRSDDIWCKTVMGSFSMTAPQSMGWLAGMTMSVGGIYGFDSAANTDSGVAGEINSTLPGGLERLNLYAGLTIPTPIQGLAFGAAFDYTSFCGSRPFSGPFSSPIIGDSTDSLSVDAFSIALYATWQATEKLSLNLRGEFVHGCADTQENDSDYFGSYDSITSSRFNADVLSLTATLQYNLWENVISRLELRYDTVCGQSSQNTTYFDEFGFDGSYSSRSKGCEDSLSLYLNFIYKF